MLDYSFSHLMVINGQLVGSWRRGQKKNAVEVELWPFSPLKSTERKLIEKAAERYQAFLHKPVRLIN
jgi:hypothetical protein